MSGRVPPSQQQRDSVVDSLIICGAVIAALVVFWFAAHEKIASVVMWIRGIESHLVFSDYMAKETILRWNATTHPKDVSFGQLSRSGEILGNELRWWVMGFLAALGLFVAYRSPEWPGRYNKIYTMKSLARQESALWPTIRPVLDADLINVPIDDPVQGMRMRARDYGVRYKFVVPTISLKKLPAGAEPISIREVFLVDRARKVLGKQLGKTWSGIDAMQPHERALFAAFAAQANYDADSALALINELPDHYVRAVKKGKPSLITSPKVESLLAKHASSDAVKRAVTRHAYTRTVLMSMLIAAQGNGIFPPAWFRWLKTVDRITWYALADLGTDNASAEACGVRSHWNAERALRTPINEPEVEAAVDGIRDYLQEILDEDPEND